MSQRFAFQFSNIAADMSRVRLTMLYRREYHIVVLGAGRPPNEPPLPPTEDECGLRAKSTRRRREKLSYRFVGSKIVRSRMLITVDSPICTKCMDRKL